MLVPTASDRTDGLDHRTGRPFPAELLIGELPDGWWAVDGHQVQAPDGEGPRLFDSVGPMPGIEAALFGAYPGAYALIGGFTFIVWARLGAENANRARAFTLIGFLLGIQLLFGVVFGGAPDWIADLAGFGAGFLLSFVVGPGGPAALLRHIRQRLAGFEARKSEGRKAPVASAANP